MRVLVVTNFYPPHELGGQGRSCQQVVAGLRGRGHDVAVLTSRHGVSDQTQAGSHTEDNIFRTLYLEMALEPWRHGLNFFTQRKKRERDNLVSFRQLASAFLPDVVFVWGMWNLPRSLPADIEAKFPGKVLYRFAEYWPTLPSQHVHYWQTPGRKWFTRLPKKAMGTLALKLLDQDRRQHALRFQHCYCVSAATRDALVAAGIPVSHAHIIHTGIDVSQFSNAAQGNHEAPGAFKNPPDGCHMLYAGRLHPQKGLETVFEALAHIKRGATELDVRFHVHLTIAGSGAQDYVAELQHQIRSQDLHQHVTFLGQVPTAGMPGLLQMADILVVPSLWIEPFSRIVLEGMAAHTAVLAARTGGTVEIVEDGKNGLLFAAGDSQALAHQITRLVANPQLRRSLAGTGYQTVCERFSFETMMDKIETLLLKFQI